MLTTLLQLLPLKAMFWCSFPFTFGGGFSYLMVTIDKAVQNEKTSARL